MTKKNEFTIIPEGDQLLRMTRYQESPIASGKGVKAEATFQIINGDYKNRLIFDMFLVEHENAKAEEIGTDRLNNYLKAVGVKGGLDDLGQDRTLISEYLEAPFIGSVAIEKGKEYVKDGKTMQGKDRNKVKTFKAR